MVLRFALLAALAAAAVLAGPAEARVRFEERDEPLASARVLAGGARVVLAEPAPFRFDLIGIRWRGSGRVWFRVLGPGGWSEWRDARPEGEDLPDRGSAERARRAGWTLGNPWWTGPAGRIEYRLDGVVTRLRAGFVRSDPRPLRRLALAETPGIVSRSGWGADETIVRAKPAISPRVAFAIVHHTAGQRPSSPEESAAVVRAIQVYHVKANGWNDIGYNFVVDPFGQIFEGRGGGVDRNVVGAHAEGFNTGSVGVAVLGTYSDAGVTPEARDAVARLLAWRLDGAHVDPVSRLTWTSAGSSRFPTGADVELAAVSGHRDTGLTACPGDGLYAQLGEIAAAAAVTGLPKLYDPVVAGSIGGPVTFAARLSDALPWTVVVTDAAGNRVAEGSGVGPGVSWTWDAAAAAKGSYAYRIDAGPLVVPAVGTIGGRVALAVNGLSAQPAAIAPDGDGLDEASTISFTLTTPAAVSVSLEDAAGGSLALLLPEQTLPAGPHELAWGGTAPDGTPLPDGAYRVVVRATAGAKQASAAAAVVVDRALARVSVATPVVSPNGDGRFDELQVSFDLARPASVRVRVTRDGKSVARVFLGDLPAGSQTLVWAGRRRGGVVRDGQYAVEVTATTELVARSVAQPFAVDTQAPRIVLTTVRVRKASTKLLFELSEAARLKILLDGRPFWADRPAGQGSFWQRVTARRIRVVAWDAAGNRGEPVVVRRT
jgi:hypothetical protein